MHRILLKYGKREIPFEFESSRFQVLESAGQAAPLSDEAIGTRLDDPVDSERLEELVSPGETVLIVVPDATRQAGAGQIVNLVVRRLIANGIPPHDIRIIFATGIHRRVTEEEKSAIVTPFIAQRIKMLDHDPRDLMQIVRLGELSSGIPIELNRALVEHDKVILVGGISFHYFAGFTGGRKLICPGLASAKTVAATHKLAFDCSTISRRSGVGTGLLVGNAVHDAFSEAVAKMAPAFAVNTIVDDRGEVVDLFCGDWKTSHSQACEVFAASHKVIIDEKRDVVVVSCGGSPHDVNMIQAHKALDSASLACRDGGTIILLAECTEGLGKQDFIDWFRSETSEELGAKLCENYKVNGQTAWSFLTKAERFDVRLISQLDARTAESMRATPMQSLSRALAKTAANSKGYILPNGAMTLPVIKGQ